MEWIVNRQRAGEPLRLDFIQATNQVTGAVLKAFSLNDTFLISDNSSVLTLPFPPQRSVSKETAISPDQYVGIWLQDFGDHDRLHREAEKVLSTINDRRTDKYGRPDWSQKDEYKEHIHLKRGLNEFEAADFISDQIIAGLAENMPSQQAKKLLGMGEVRISRKKPHTDTWHNDNASQKADDLWNYIITYPFLRTGTVFSVCDSQSKKPDSIFVRSSAISVPTYTTSSHLTLQLCGRWDLTYKGPMHRAQGHENGRGIIIYSEFAEDREWQPIRDVAAPWQILKCKLAEAGF